MKRCSTLLSIKETQIKTTVRYHVQTIRMTVVKKTDKNMRTRMWRNCNPHALLVKMYNGTADLENSCAVPQKTKQSITTWTSKFTPRYLRKRNENIRPHKKLRTSVDCSIIFLNWSIIDSQYCVGFRCIAKWFSYIYNWIYILNVYIFFFRFFFHYRLLQGIECSFLCYTIGSCWLSILYIMVYIR